MSAVKYPFGFADNQSPAHALTLAVTISDAGLNIVNIASSNTVSTVTMNITNAITPVDGTTILVKFPVGSGGRTLTPGTLMSGPGITGVAAKTHTATFVWMGDKYYQTSAIQLD